ncbi:hypothetical protein [Polyangium sp. 6x1]|uniref:hypothetical protein n=1 Tax=Polyangium sp. 6x1 TaxID=3042689 RepID=UPI0024827AF0|nr:hypothetical protein [Polyangium sp. 6x1]MDI1444704.1 hypothetical protein [Polyangium sp. 6x1]
MPIFLPLWWWQWWRSKPAPAPAPAPKGDGSLPFFRWFHRESDLDGASYAALVTAMRGDWMKLDPKSRVRQFRALVLLSLRIAPISYREFELGDLRPELYSDDERNAAGAAIARTLVLLSPSGLRAVSDAQTDEGNPAVATGVTDTGVVVTVVVVALAALCTLAAVFLGAHAAVRVNFDDEITKRLLSTQAFAIQVLTLHIERERAVGHELAFSNEERSLLMQLEDDQKRLATMQGRPLPSPFEGAKEFARETARAATSMTTLALVLVGAYFLLKQRRS